MYGVTFHCEIIRKQQKLILVSIVFSFYIEEEVDREEEDYYEGKKNTQ